jgi:ribosomal-protein-serine acetyltransferase
MSLRAVALEITPNLHARPAIISDAPALAELVRNNLTQISSFLPAVAALATVAGAKNHLQRVAELAVREELLEWNLFSDGALCGSLRINHIEKDTHKVAIGYFVGTEYQGRGIATKSVRAVTAYCFNVLNVNRIELRCATSNGPSMRVAERSGFIREGILRQAELLGGAYADLYLYSLLRDEFARTNSTNSTNAIGDLQ